MIVFLVLIQLILIGSTFSILYAYSLEQKNYADFVNVAGKNRFHTAFTIHTLSEFESGDIGKSELLSQYDNMRQNISLLRHGGDLNGEYMPPLPASFNSDLTSVEEKFKQFEDLADELINAKNLEIELDESFFTKHETLETELIGVTETLTVNITDEFENISYEQERLEIILPILNGIVYVITILTIFKILQKEGKKLQKLEKLYAIGQMSSRLAHDLRNPIHVIKMNLELLKRNSGIEQSVKDKYNRIERSVADMNYIIDDVLEFVKTKELNLERHSLLKIISESVSSLNVPADIQIELPKEDVSLTCDGRKIQAMIVNLVVNSFDAIKKKGTITIKLEDNPNHVTIQVIDSGPGIPDDIKSKIFEPLFTSKDTGTGLGLGISKNIVNQHGGKMSVENNPTTFTIVLPKK